MQIFAQVWCEYDPVLHLKTDRKQGTVVAPGDDKLLRVSPTGQAGVEMALKLDENKVTAWAAGPQHEPALRAALAAGAQNALIFLPPEGSGGSKEVAQQIANWVESLPQEKRPDLAIGGKICAYLSWYAKMSHLAGLSHLYLENGRLQGTRPTGKGARELVFARLPACISLQRRGMSSRYICRDRINQASDLPIQKILLHPLKNTQQQTSWTPPQTLRLKTRGVKKTGSPGTMGGLGRLQALLGNSASSKPRKPKDECREIKSPAEQAEELVRYLMHHDLIDLREEPGL